MIYTLPSENVAGLVTPVLQTGTDDPNNPLANLTNGDPAIPFMTSDALGIAARWDYTAAQRADYVSIPMHGIPAGTLVRYQMNDTDVWTSPTVDAALTMVYDGDFPRVAAADLTLESGYDAAGFRYHRLFVPSHGGITKIGDIEVWSTKRAFLFALRFGVRPTLERQVVVQPRKDGGRIIYDHQLQARAVQGTFRHDATEFAKLKALQLDAKGPVSPFLIHVTAALEHFYVWWPGALDFSLGDVDAHDVNVEFMELGRGMPL